MLRLRSSWKLGDSPPASAVCARATVADDNDTGDYRRVALAPDLSLCSVPIQVWAADHTVLDDAQAAEPLALRVEYFLLARKFSIAGYQASGVGQSGRLLQGAGQSGRLLRGEQQVLTATLPQVTAGSQRGGCGHKQGGHVWTLI